MHSPARFNDEARIGFTGPRAEAEGNHQNVAWPDQRPQQANRSIRVRIHFSYRAVALAELGTAYPKPCGAPEPFSLLHSIIPSPIF
jgi:hypothetical protein